MKNILNIIKQEKWLFLILLIATGLRFYKLDYQSLWMDEIYTMNVANSQKSFKTIIFEVNTTESFPYLYFFFTNILFSIFGDTSLVARLPSAIFGIMSVWIIYKLGKEIHSKNAGLIAALLFALNEYAIYYSQEARAYSLYVFCLLFSYYRFAIFLKNDKNINMFYFALSAGLLLNVNFFSIFNVIAQGIVLLFILFYTEKDKRIDYLKKMLIILGIVALFFLPNAYKFYLITQIESFWTPAPNNEILTNILKEYVSNSEILVFIYSTLFIYFILNVFNQKQTKTFKEIISSKLVFSYFFLFFWFFTVLVIFLLKSYLGLSIFVSRYLVSVFPVIILIISISLCRIINDHVKFLHILMLVFFMSFNLIVVKKYYTTTSKTQFREASEFIIDNNKNNEPIYTSLKYWYDYFLNTKNVKTNLIEKPNLDAVIDEMIADTTKIKSFWYTDGHIRPYKVTENTQKFLDEKFVIENNIDLFDCYVRHFVLNNGESNIFTIPKYTNLTINNGDNFMSNIEKFDFSNNKLNTIGWAFFETGPSTNSKYTIVLINNNIMYKLKTLKVFRPDNTSYFKTKYDVSNSGFNSSIDINNMPKGRYQLAIYLVNQEIIKEGLLLTGRFVEKNN